MQISLWSQFYSHKNIYVYWWLRTADCQDPLNPDSQQFITINIHSGLYQYKRLPFGIASSQAIFQQTIDIILQGLEHVAAIEDDILNTRQGWWTEYPLTSLFLSQISPTHLPSVQAATIITTPSPTKAVFVTLITSEDIWISRSVSWLRVGDS